MTSFYTNVQVFGNNILYRGVLDGKRIKQKIEYTPSLFEPTSKETKFKTLSGDFLNEKVFDCIRDARDYLKQYNDVSGKVIYGNSRFEYSFIADRHPGTIEWDENQIKIATIDIEVGSENGFPDPSTASEPITAICIKFIGQEPIVFGCGEYAPTGRELYFNCKDEYSLCKKFLKYWCENYPDIVTGWNIKFFDFPYLYNRFCKILGEDLAKLLSPWKYISRRNTVMMGKDHTVYEFVGISTLDYFELYRKYAPGGTSQESYKLDHIANVELNKKKLSYDEYDNLHDLYKQNYQKFIEYNIVDVRLVEELEEKLKLIELALTLAYDSKTNYTDVFTQVTMWDILIYNHLKEQNIIIPPKTKSIKSEAFEGAYVKDPQVGLHHYVASFDLNSLYPHLIIQYNISPETFIDPSEYTKIQRDIISSGINVNKLLKKQVDLSQLSGCSIAANGQFFRTDIQGFLPKMMEKMYDDRKVYKKKAIDAKKELEKETDPSKKFEIEKRIARYNNLQLAKKVCLNSAYGALGNEYFRFFDVRQASAITLSGQLSIRWIEMKLNEYMNNILKSDNVDYVIASDTDSIYLRLGELVNKVFEDKVETQKVINFMDKVCEDKIQPFIDKSYQELAEYVHAYDQKMQMKREALADRGIWTAKKRYIMHVHNNEGVQYSTPQIKVMGLEMVKSSTPAPIREKMREAINIMMTGNEKQLHKFISDFRQEFLNFPIEDISFPRGIRGTSTYADKMTIYKKSTPIHVKGALIYNHLLEQNNLTKKYPLIKEGEKIKFTYLKQPNHIKDTVISYPVRLPVEFNLEKYVDYDMQFDKAFIEPIKIILDCIDWNIEERVSLWD
jgi:DNA polymerase elongation subunit (family B)